MGRAASPAMKFLVVLLSLAALTWAQDYRKECQCGAFVTVPQGEYLVHGLEPINIGSCDEATKCAAHCALEWRNVSDNGDLDHVMDNGDTVGKEACRAMNEHGHPNLGPHYVFAYYNVCGGPWVFDGEVSQQELCCREGVYQC